MVDLMLDLETMGNTPRAAIIQIGACHFDRHTGEIGDTFSANISLKSCLEAGLEVTGETVEWWLNQSAEARESLCMNRRNIRMALLEFCRPEGILKGIKCIWSHATFDFVILQNAFHATGLKGFPYRWARDLRTLVDLSGIDTKPELREGVHHNALDDCIYQVAYAVRAMNAIRGNR